MALRLAFGELAEMLLLGQRVVPARALAGGFTFRFLQIDTALADVLGRTR
jgi:NAD dependent epimerase/dehydratase family enzyme